ncbi:hypothetical protein AOQ84DRAFT_383431 [Glonium stellatum]|uniref:Uncharacterized protein n=1 Tax=Glonium stellatum TaxID=574774 RepID=A0A8E2ENI4_9PEZI|nr:hypothetical protein AOQ84DRAFT_383431 [Glonium stellatum]
MNYLRMLSNDWNGPTAHFALLSRWKQLSAALMYSTYVRDAFSLFNSRTVNIERATNDLDPLLRVYASDSKPAICGTYYAMARDHMSENPVMFPSLLRVIDGDGKRFAEPVALGKKIFLKDE